MVVRSHETKKKAALAAIAVSIARSRNDVLYHKLKKYRNLWKETKNQILQKYGSAALQQWSKKQAGG
jgi:hypothetical protein